MSNSKFKLYFIFLAIGFVLLALDVDIKTNLSYPAPYNNTENVIGEFQFYNIASTYGAKCTYKFIDTSASEDNGKKNAASSDSATASANTTQTKVIDKVFFDNIHIDIFNDFIGFLLILIACVGLKKCSRFFSLSVACAFCGILLRIILKTLPFFINGLSLCNFSMVLGVAYLGSIILTTFLFTRGLFTMCPDVCCRDERKWGKITWFIAMVLQILLTFIFWIGSDFKALMVLGYITEGFLVFDIVVFWMILKRVYIYLERSYESAVSNRK